MKNKITILAGFGNHRKENKLYNFTKLDNVSIDGKLYIRIDCEGKYYYFDFVESIIHEIEIYEK